MNDLKIFNNAEFGSVRTLTIDDKPYFVGKDVAEILGYSNTRDALTNHVDEEDKNTVTIYDGIAGNPNKVVINESGLYSLIFSSKMPQAKRFTHWVTSEVLPSIRKHGLYAIDDIIANPDIGIAALQALKAEREEKLRLTARVEEMRPKVSYCDMVLRCEDALPISIIAKDYGWSASRMNTFLHEQGIQYKLHGTWLLYSDYADKGYTKSVTYPYKDSEGNSHNAVNTKWTQEGRLFIYDLMSKAGNLPLTEVEL